MIAQYKTLKYLVPMADTATEEAEESLMEMLSSRWTTSEQEVRVRPPGIEWKTGRNPQNGKRLAKK